MTTPTEDVSQPSQPLYTNEQLEQIVRAFVQKERETHQQEINSLNARVDALSASIAGNVPVTIAEHGAGIGTAIHQTWSYAEQLAQRAAHEASLAAAHAIPVVEAVLPDLNL